MPQINIYQLQTKARARMDISKTYEPGLSQKGSIKLIHYTINIAQLDFTVVYPLDNFKLVERAEGGGYLCKIAEFMKVISI